MRFLALILDAIDPDNLHMFDMPYIQKLYKQEGDVLGCSTMPHTAASNPMIWGGIHNTSRFWITGEGVDHHNASDESLRQDVMDIEGQVDPARYFDRDKGDAVDGARTFTRKDYEGDSFIWDDLVAEGYDARALQVPVVLPPYSYNTNRILSESWFPDTSKRMAAHIRKKPELIIEELEDGADFVATSIQMPDKWLHGIAEGKCTEEFSQAEAKVLDEKVKEIVEYCKENGIHYAIFGDHGSPHPGAMKCGQFILPRHRKESVIISDLDDAPTYTDELYPWFLEMFDAEPVNEYVEPERTPEAIDEDEEEIKDRLENLGYR